MRGLPNANSPFHSIVHIARRGRDLFLGHLFDIDPDQLPGVRKMILEPRSLLRLLRRRLPGRVHEGRRGVVTRTYLRLSPRIVKSFKNTPEAQASFKNERLAHELFNEKLWKIPVLEFRDDGLVMPDLRASKRLDHVAKRVSETERRRLAVEALSIALDIHSRGYAHRDFHAANFFVVGDRLLLGDFESMGRYPEGGIPAFRSSYDLVGEGLDSPFHTGKMCYVKDSPSALQSVLGVPLKDALDGLGGLLKEELREVCQSFEGRASSGGAIGSRRHQCKSNRIYGSFRLPGFLVSAEEAQRDSAKRFAKFSIQPSDISGFSLLDLGSNIGAMTFCAQAMDPVRSLGIEYDKKKVETSQRISSFGGLRNVEFRQGDIDRISTADLGGQWDVVFCLAIESHVKDEEHLYSLLSEVTGRVLFFEGNGGCDIAAVTARLRRGGFREIRELGFCDDDVRPQNNNRPILVARR